MRSSKTSVEMMRIKKELDEVCRDDGTSGVTASAVNKGDNRHLKGKIKGPQGTPYEHGIFEIDITIPNQYPFIPPKMNFITRIWHPNISSQTGAICLVRTFIAVSTSDRIPRLLPHLAVLICDHSLRTY